MTNTQELRDGITRALADLEVTRASLDQLLELIDQEESPAPRVATSESGKSEDSTLIGKIGRPKLTETPSGIALWEAGMQVTKEDGSKEWINIQAWRKTAIYASENLPSASMASAVGRFETEQWTDDHGNQRERRKFVVKHFVEPK